MKIHSRFVPTPIIHDTLELQLYQRGQWVRLAWCDHLSRFHEWTDGHVRAFHYPNASGDFASYCKAQAKGKRRLEEARAKRALIESEARQ